MNPYRPPKAPVGNTGDSAPWLRGELRRAAFYPPLLAAPGAFVFVLFAQWLESGNELFLQMMTSVTWIVLLTAGAYVLQVTYGALCYLFLWRLRLLNLPSFLVASVLPVVVACAALAEARSDVLGFAMYGFAALLVGWTSWYFAVWRANASRSA